MVDPMKYFYDIGANVGQTFDLHLLKRPDLQDAHVLCFEPSPRHLQALLVRAAACASRFASVSVCPFALGGGFPRELQMFEKTQPLADSLDHDFRQNAPTGYRVLCAVVPISSFIGDHTRSEDSVELKIDTEGAEYEILDDLLEAPDLLPRLTRVQVEWHDAMGYSAIDARRQYEQAFASHGVSLEVWSY
jgi:FkbM family methyltransferase